MLRFVFILAFVLCGLLLTGCLSAPTAPLPQFDVRQQRFLEGAPAPVVAAPDDRSSSPVLDAVQIRPATTITKEDLPTSVTAIYVSTPRDLTIAEVVNELLANNRAIKIEGYSLRIAEYEIPVSKGIYDLMLSGLTRYERIEQQQSPNGGFGTLDKTSARTWDVQAGLSQLFPTGATLMIGAEFLRNTQLVPFFGFSGISGVPSALPSFTFSGQNVKTYSGVGTIQVTQPLLRGFGSDVTNANIRIAQLERRGAAADFQAKVEDTLRQALESYWQLLGALQLYKVGVISYASARDLLRMNTAKFRAGTVPRTDVLQAEAAAEQRRDQLLRLRRAVRDEEDILKRLIHLQPGTPDWKVELKPAQPFTWREVSVDLEQQITVAEGRRAELRRAQAQIDKSVVNLKVARNNRLPQLDLFGRADTNSTEDTPGSAFETSAGGDYTGYAAGLQFSYPLQNRAARYRYKQAEAAQAQATESYADTEDQITLEVRQAVRALRTARERIDATQTEVRSEELKLENQTKRYEVGVATAFEVLTFQEDLANAQARHLQAVVDYNTALIGLERTRGTLLESYGVEIPNVDLDPREKPVKWPVGLN